MSAGLSGYLFAALRRKGVKGLSGISADGCGLVNIMAISSIYINTQNNLGVSSYGGNGLAARIT
jgi:hypothetical protein